MLNGRRAGGHLTLAAIVVLTLAAAPAAHAEVRRDLIAGGVTLAGPMLILGTAMHEGSHALAARLVGGRVDSVVILPTRDRSGDWHFGLTRASGLRTRGQRAWFYAAPKLTNLLVLAGYTTVRAYAWPETDSWQLLLTTVAVAAWVDFGKDVVVLRPSNDVYKLFALAGWQDLRAQLPARLAYAALSLGLGYLVWRGVDDTLHAPSWPIAAARF